MMVWKSLQVTLPERPGSVLLINPDLAIDVPPIHFEDKSSEVDTRDGRYGELVPGLESEDEEHFDPPYVEWEREHQILYPL